MCVCSLYTESCTHTHGQDPASASVRRHSSLAALVPLTWPWLRSCGERKCNFCISSFFRQSSKQAGRLSPGRKKAGQGLGTPSGLRVTPTQCRLLRESQRELSLGRTCPQGWEQLPSLGSPHRSVGCGTLGLGCHNSPCEEQQQGCWAQAPRASNSWRSCSCSNGSDTV